MAKVHVKKDDQVIVITGKDAGKQGKVLSVNPEAGRVVVEKVAVVQKHMKPTQQNPKGGIVAQESAIDASNVMIYCPKCKKGVRISKKVNADGTRNRVCSKCGENFDK